MERTAAERRAASPSGRLPRRRRDEAANCCPLTSRSISSHRDKAKSAPGAEGMMNDLEYIAALVAKGGPEPADYVELSRLIGQLHEELTAGPATDPKMQALRSALGDCLSTETLQGFALAKPYGYAGDFEIIDRIYRTQVSQRPDLAKWDRFFHHQAAPIAVRNRKAFFQTILTELAEHKCDARVLNVASGPGRCMHEWLCSHPNHRLSFHCVELDPKAIEFAVNLNGAFIDRVTFTQANALRWHPSSQFDLVWSAGLFDYFSDSLFIAALKRLTRAAAPGGEVIVGNFGVANPSRPYMELFGEWFLHHRSPEQLLRLASSAGFGNASCRIESEATGINLFLRIKL
jgi:SAM-dependent methyltransferase